MVVHQVCVSNRVIDAAMLDRLGDNYKHQQCYEACRMLSHRQLRVFVGPLISHLPWFFNKVKKFKPLLPVIMAISWLHLRVVLLEPEISVLCNINYNWSILCKSELVDQNLETQVHHSHFSSLFLMPPLHKSSASKYRVAVSQCWGM